MNTVINTADTLEEIIAGLNAIGKTLTFTQLLESEFSFATCTVIATFIRLPVHSPELTNILLKSNAIVKYMNTESYISNQKIDCPVLRSTSYDDILATYNTNLALFGELMSICKNTSILTKLINRLADPLFKTIVCKNKAYGIINLSSYTNYDLRLCIAYQDGNKKLVSELKKLGGNIYTESELTNSYAKMLVYYADVETFKLVVESETYETLNRYFNNNLLQNLSKIANSPIVPSIIDQSDKFEFLTQHL